MVEEEEVVAEEVGEVLVETAKRKTEDLGKTALTPQILKGIITSNLATTMVAIGKIDP